MMYIMGMDARKNLPEVAVQVSDTKNTADSAGVSGSLVSPPMIQRFNFINVILRLLCFLTSVTALSVMLSAKQASTISMFGLDLPVSSKWSFSNSFQYLVGVTATVALHSLLQLVHGITRIQQKSTVISSRNYAWLLFAGDQLLAYMLMSAGSAAAGVTNLNRTGIRHSALPNFCKPLHKFCDHVAVSITFTLVSCLFLAASAVTDVIWLSKH